jgi:hypothetical protein
MKKNFPLLSFILVQIKPQVPSYGYIMFFIRCCQCVKLFILYQVQCVTRISELICSYTPDPIYQMSLLPPHILIRSFFPSFVVRIVFDVLP